MSNRLFKKKISSELPFKHAGRCARPFDPIIRVRFLFKGERVFFPASLKEAGEILILDYCCNFNFRWLK